MPSDFWEKQIEIAPKISKNLSNNNFFFSHNTCGCCSVAKSCPALCDPMDYSTLGLPKELVSFTISQSFLKFMSAESVMLSNHVILWCPLLLPSIFPSIQVFSSELTHHITWPNYWTFNIILFNEYSSLISLVLTGLIFSWSKGPSWVFSSTTLWKHQFFSS